MIFKLFRIKNVNFFNSSDTINSPFDLFASSYWGKTALQPFKTIPDGLGLFPLNLPRSFEHLHGKSWFIFLVIGHEGKGKLSKGLLV